MKKLKIKKIDIRSNSNVQGTNANVIGGFSRCWWIQTSPRGGNPNEGYYHCMEI